MTKNPILSLTVIACLAGCLTSSWALAEQRVATVARRDFSFGYWMNGWRKSETDGQADILAFETGYYGFALDMDDLRHPRFGLINDNAAYAEVAAAGTSRMDDLDQAEMDISVDVDGKTYRAVSCWAGTGTGLQRLNKTRLWESGRYGQHFDLQGVRFEDCENNALGFYGHLDLVGWPQSLTFNLDLTAEPIYRDGAVPGVAGNGRCIIETPLDIPHRPELDPEQLTLEGWYKLPESMNQDTDGWLLCKNENEWSKGNYGFWLGGRRVEAIMNIAGGAGKAHKLAQRGKLPIGTWNHLVMTYDGNTMRLFINGFEHNKKVIGQKREPGIGLLRIGQRPDGELAVVKGLYDQVRVWNRALPPQEIDQHLKTPGQLSNRQGLVFEETFDAPGVSAITPPVWKDAKVRICLKSAEHEWQTGKQIGGDWKAGEKRSLTLNCNLPGFQPDQGVSLTARSPLGQQFPVVFSARYNCLMAEVRDYQRSFKSNRGGLTDIRDYDEFIVEVDNPAKKEKQVPFLLYFWEPAAITGICPMVCDENGVPTGIPIQLSKNWHNGPSHLGGYTVLPAKPGLSRYRIRISYGFYGTLPSVSHSQLSLIGAGGNARWDQLAVGCWGETFCLNVDYSLPPFMFTDLRGLFLRKGKEGKRWGWSLAGWGGGWLDVKGPDGRKLFFRDMKTAYLSQGPCLTDVHYTGSYGAGSEASLKATIRTARVDDHIRTFSTARYEFNKPLDAKDAKLFRFGGGYLYTGPGMYDTPKLAYGNREGLIAEIDNFEGTKHKDWILDKVTLAGEGPWWIAFPGQNEQYEEPIPSGSMGLIIRGYRAFFGGKAYTNPTVSVPVNLKAEDGRVSLIPMVVPPNGVTRFRPGDWVELDVECDVVPRIADDYYGPNEAFRKHLEEHPRSWKTIHRNAAGNALEVQVAGGKETHNYPLIIQAEADRVSVDIKGGVGMVPIRFDGLLAAQGYALYEVVDGKERKLDQSVHGNDFWQTDYDTASGTYRLVYNLPLDGKPASRWILKQAGSKE